MSIAIIYHVAGGKNIEKEIPGSLGRRTKFLSKCLKKLPTLAPFKTEGLDLIKTIKKETGIRNSVVHGYFSHFNAEKNLSTFTLISSKMDKQMHTEVLTHYTGQELLDAGGRILNLATNMGKFSRSLANALQP